VAERRELVKLEPAISSITFFNFDGPSNLTLFETEPALYFFVALNFWFVLVQAKMHVNESKAIS
jgi:hypothetical protein